MAYKGTAGKSASGASMSKYDVEVETRLKAIEAEIRSIKESLASHGHGHTGGADCGDTVALIERLNQIPAITEYCPKDPDGVRRLKV